MKAARQGCDPARHDDRDFIALDRRAQGGQLQDHRGLARPAVANQQEPPAGKAAAGGVKHDRAGRKLCIGPLVAIAIEEIQGGVGIVPDGDLAPLLHHAIGLVLQQCCDVKAAGDGEILPGILRQVIEPAVQGRTVRGDGNLERQNLEPLLEKRHGRARQFCLRAESAEQAFACKLLKAGSDFGIGWLRQIIGALQQCSDFAGTVLAIA